MAKPMKTLESHYPMIQFLIKPGSHVLPTYMYLRRSPQLQPTTFGNLSQWVTDASAKDRRHTQTCSICKSNCPIFNHFTSKYGLSRLPEVRRDRRWCSLKTFSSLTIADNCQLSCEVELSSTLQASRRSYTWDRLCAGDKCSHMPQLCPRPCRRLCPRYVGGIWEPGLTWYQTSDLM